MRWEVEVDNASNDNDEHRKWKHIAFKVKGVPDRGERRVNSNAVSKVGEEPVSSNISDETWFSEAQRWNDQCAMGRRR